MCVAVCQLYKLQVLTLFADSVRDHLAPLAAAANTIQSDNCRLDTVLIALANLYRMFSDSKYDLEIRRSILRSLEK